MRFLANANRERSITLVMELISRYAELVTTPEGIRFIAYCHAWLPQSVFDEMIGRIEASDWILAQQAIGELLVLRVALVPGDDRSSSALRRLLGSPFTTDAHLGLVYTSAATWTNPRVRDVSHEILVAAAPWAKDEIAEALMGVFWLRGSGRLPIDALTSKLLEAIALAPNLFLTTSTTELIERLKELLADGYSPIAVGKLARRIVEVAADAIASNATSLSVSATDLVDIAFTLQRFPDARPDGTWVLIDDCQCLSNCEGGG
jgi:hypothetical protein